MVKYIIICSILTTYFRSLNLSMSSHFLPSTCLQASSSLLNSEHKKSYYNVKYNKINLIQAKNVSHLSHSYYNHPFIKTTFSQSHSSLSLVAQNAKGSGAGEEDDGRALETVLKLYTAIKDRDLDVLSDIIGEECRCVCNFVSTFQPWEGKTQVLRFFSYLLGKLGENIEFVVQPTFSDGMSVGVHWKLEWKETKITLGQGFSFYMCHVYQGKVVIKNVEMIMEPLLHIAPLRLKIMGTIMNAVDKFSTTNVVFNDIGRGIIKHALVILPYLLAAVVLFLRFAYDQ